jgi:hypothetical protein
MYFNAKEFIKKITKLPKSYRKDATNHTKMKSDIYMLYNIFTLINITNINGKN